MKKILGLLLLSASFQVLAISPGEIAAAGLLQGSPALKTGDSVVVGRPGYLVKNTNDVTTDDLATKLGTNDLVNTLSGYETDKVPSVAAVNDGLAGKVDATDGTASNLTVTDGMNVAVTSTNKMTFTYDAENHRGVLTEIENGTTTNIYYFANQ